MAKATPVAQVEAVPYVSALDAQKKKKRRALVYDPLTAPNFYQVSPMDIAVISAQLLATNS